MYIPCGWVYRRVEALIRQRNVLISLYIIEEIDISLSYTLSTVTVHAVSTELFTAAPSNGGDPC